MLSKLLSLWRALSLLIAILSGWIVWQGVKILKDAGAATRPVAASAALATHGEPVCLRDTLELDPSGAGLGQSNVMGWKGKEFAVIPTHPQQDTAHLVLVVTSDPSWIGPVVNDYLTHMSSSLGSSNYDIKGSAAGDKGIADPQLRALLQELGGKLKDRLRDTLPSSALVVGVGAMRPAADYPQVPGLEGNVLVIRSGYLPTTGEALPRLGGGILLFLVNAALWFYDRKRRARIEREEEEQEPPPSLV